MELTRHIPLSTALSGHLGPDAFQDAACTLVKTTSQISVLLWIILWRGARKETCKHLSTSTGAMKKNKAEHWARRHGNGVMGQITDPKGDVYYEL